SNRLLPPGPTFAVPLRYRWTLYRRGAHVEAIGPGRGDKPTNLRVWRLPWSFPARRWRSDIRPEVPAAQQERECGPSVCASVNRRIGPMGHPPHAPQVSISHRCRSRPLASTGARAELRPGQVGPPPGPKIARAAAAPLPLRWLYRFLKVWLWSQATKA